MIKNLYLWSVLVALVIGLTSISARAVPQPKPVRALHVVINPLTRADLIRLTDSAATAGFNTMILDLGNKVAFVKFPGGLLKTAWSRDEFLSIVEYIRSKGIEVIPAVKLLTKQGFLFTDKHPELMFNQQTYDPGNPAVYKIIYPYLDEIIATLNPRAIHIGHDELSVWNKHSAKWEHVGGEDTLPAKLFLQDVQQINSYLKQHGVETWMWGDMLISPEEFPSMLPSYFNGLGAGYGSALRHQIPKDVVICDWHYFDDQREFPSLAMFKTEGFRVLGGTWRKAVATKNFSHYAAQNGAIGMVATSWFDPNPNRKEAGAVGGWDEMNQIIRESGEAFSKDFPDAK